MRLLAISVLTALLAGCSASSRVEDIVPAWANTPAPHPAMQRATRRNQLEGRGAVAAEPRSAAEAPSDAKKPAAAPEPQAKKPDSQNASEE
jgi:hypothetical protein